MLRRRNGKGFKGNIVSKYRIRKVSQKEVGESTLGGRDIWLDENIGRLNTDRQGRYLGSFNTEDAIIAIYDDGSYELTDFKLTNRYKLSEIKLIKKFNPKRIITAVHYDGGAKSYYVKRFYIETSTLGKRFGFISEEWGSKLNLVIMEEVPVLSFSYSTKQGEKKTKQENLSDLVNVKGWKAMGNKLGNYLHMSRFQWIDNSSSLEVGGDNNGNTDDDLTLFT